MGSAEWNALANPNFEGKGGYGQGSEDKVDKGHKAGMQTFGKTYNGLQDQAGGVFAMLEVMGSHHGADTHTELHWGVPPPPPKAPVPFGAERGPHHVKAQLNSVWVWVPWWTPLLRV